MKQYLVTALAAAILFSSCGSSKKEDNAALAEKKAALEKLKADKEKLDFVSEYTFVFMSLNCNMYHTLKGCG